MAERTGSQRRTEAEHTGTQSGTTRRRVLALTGSGLLAAVTGVGAASAASGESGDTAERSVADGGPIGGGKGYSNAVTAGDATAVVSGLGDLESVLASASEGDVVFVDGEASLALGSTSLTVPAGVTLASDRGVDGSPGAELATGAEPTDLLTLQADARVTGLRVVGPHPGGDGGGSSSARGLTVAGDGVEIDNTAIRGFSYAGVFVRSGEAHVHHSVIRECNKGGLGYGVSQVSGDNTIEYNYFDFNRHSVATDGSHTGYTCRYNHFGPKTTSHVIDAHAPAGTRYEIHNNVVEAVADVDGQRRPAVAIRGVPDDVATVCYNWFWNGTEPADQASYTWTEEAIIQPEVGSTWQNVEFSGNVYGEDAGVGFGDVIPEYTGWRSD